MAADQRRKRLNGATLVGCNSREQHRAKKKNMGVNEDDSNINPHISLEWDGSQKMVVAKRDQIGISWNDLKPYIDSTTTSHNIPADVFVVPHGIYELKNLEDVLSYEVWQTHLSENERSHLMQFLPRGSEAQQVVKALLAGDYFHFGNPFLKWGASLCSGNFHPDAILHREQCLMTDKKVYYKELQKYHNDLIAYLLKLKEIYARCEDPEKEFLQKIWRSRKDMEKHSSSHANESRFRDLDENATPTSESGSWVADDKACSSDNQISSVIKGGELQNRFCEKGFLKDKNRQKLLTEDDALNVGAIPKKGDKLHKRNNIYNNDGAKYMSYVKISKKQREIVKSMKQSGRSIQFRSLNRVLGNDCNIQPYQVFVEEEQKKLHEHWLQLARKDLPVAYAIWMEMRLQRRRMTVSLETDMKERLESVMEDEGNENHSVFQDELGVENHESTMHDDEKSVPDLPQGEDFHMEEDEKSQLFTDGHVCNITDIESEKHLCRESDNDSEKDIITESDHSPPNLSEYSGNLSIAHAAVSQEAHLCSSGDAWKAVSMPHSYYDSTTNHEYASVSELSVTLPQVNEEHQTHILDLESDFPVGNIGKDVLHRQSDSGSFSSYPNQDRNELLQSLFKGQGMLSYPLQKQAGLDFRPPNNVFMGNGQFPVHFEEQQHQSLPLELGQKRENGVYIPQNLTESIYSDGGRYLIPRQEHLTPVNFQDWNASSVRMPGPLQSHLSGGDMLSPNWFSGEHPVHGGWSGSDAASVTSHSIGSGSTADESLFSVLSHCNQLRSGNPYHSVGSTDQFISPRNYGMVSGVTPRIGNVLPQAAHALDYLGGREAATSVVHDDLQWMNLPHQNSGLRDPVGKPFLRSWNQ
ncbi:putative nuclear factor related to kappa-B-binding protein [Rosa chinensis]|uniref:Putative nuclear factor related to kappa-B-binding protein n=1 Tax=Rosa chinensis TaxID=74649 RepID=A0A2P6S6P7_ROSCH|nr:putative nuclear factor related to kappa-B-binding protein [Rosa chinensis]